MEGRLRIKIRVPNARDAKGKPLYKIHSTGLSDTPRGRELAAQVLEQMYLELYHGIGSASTRMPTMIEAWQQFLSEKNIAPKTLQGYEYAYRAVVTNEREHISKESLRRQAVEFRKRSDEKYSPVSINTILRSYRVFIKWCEYTYSLPTVRIGDQMATEDEPQPKPFSDDECRLLIADTLSPKLSLLVKLMILTGARTVDVLTLTKDRVKTSDRNIVWANKITKQSEPRPLSSQAAEVLVALRPYAKGNSAVPFTYDQKRNLQRAWTRMQARVFGSEVEHRPLKSLRQTFLRRMEDADFPEHMQKWLMRHKTRDVTNKHYRSRDFARIRELLDSLPEL